MPSQEEKCSILKNVLAPAPHRYDWPLNIYLLDLWPLLAAGNFHEGQFDVQAGSGSANEFGQVSAGIAVLAIGAFGYLPEKVILPSSEMGPPWTTSFLVHGQHEIGVRMHACIHVSHTIQPGNGSFSLGIF